MRALEYFVLIVNAVMLAVNAIVIVFAWHYIEEHKVAVQEQRRNQFKEGVKCV